MTAWLSRLIASNTLMAFGIVARLVSLDKLVHVLFRILGLSALYIEIAARHDLCTDFTNELRFFSVYSILKCDPQRAFSSEIH